MVKKISIGIVLLNYNTSKMTLNQLQDMSNLDCKNLDTTCIVVDNNSSDNSQELLGNFKLPNMNYKFIKSSKNLGFAGGNNIGIKEAIKNGASYVVVMNNDLILKNDLLIKMVEFMDKNKDVGAASPKIYFAKGFEFHKSRYDKNELGKVIWYAGGLLDRKNVYVSHRGVDEVDKGQFSETVETDVVSGACMIIRSEVLKKVGLFDEKLFLYWEDTDFSERVKRFGMKVIFFPYTQIWHKVSSSTGGSGGNLNDYYLTRNRYYFALKYLSFRTKFAVFRDNLKLIIFGRKYQKIGAFHALVGIRGKGI